MLVWGEVFDYLVRKIRETCLSRDCLSRELTVGSNFPSSPSHPSLLLVFPSLWVISLLSFSSLVCSWHTIQSSLLYRYSSRCCLQQWSLGCQRLRTQCTTERLGSLSVPMMMTWWSQEPSPGQESGHQHQSWCRYPSSGWMCRTSWSPDIILKPSSLWFLNLSR